MDPLKLFKIPLTYAGLTKFLIEFKKLNKNTSDEIMENYPFKYRIIVNNSIDSHETEVMITLQEDPSIVIYKFKDKLISVAKLEKTDILVERTIMSKINEVYIIDQINSQILLIKRTKVNGQGIKSYINPLKLDNNLKEEALSKFITLDIEATTNMEQIKEIGDYSKITPFMVSAYNFNTGETLFSELHPYLSHLMEDFLLKLIDEKLHKYVIYAHNLTSFDGIFILKHLLRLAEDYNLKIEPIMRDGKLVLIRCRFGMNKHNKYKYYIEFHDSLLILNSSLKKLSESFLKDSPHLMKQDNEEILEYLLNEERLNILGKGSMSLNQIERQIKEYCIQDCISLSHIIHRFALFIFKHFKININKYPTISSLAMAIYLSNYLKNENLIPLISGEIYNNIRKSYHGGHTDVYELYSNEEVHSYDYTSMYPSMMLKNEMPVGPVTLFKGNPLLCGETYESLITQHAIVKCNVYVDKNLNRPLYQTNVIIDGENRTVCATGTFLNQWIYVKELCKYYDLTNGLIRIIPNSIKEEYLFNSKNIFKDYIEHLFNIKQSVNKSDPMYLISKLLMNSLYGRFGLKQELTEYKLLNKDEIEKLSLNNDIKIKDIIEFDDLEKSLLIQTKSSEDVKLKS
uniref:DNA polymerase n=1 Tax=Amanita sinensis TaxID=67728 RepID=UPI001D126F79|nr:DNA polymerase [Amanita sinensis]QZN08157.1 DNA polymerase [Amanita sinensis]